MNPKPVSQRIPIVLGGNSDPALRRAAAFGDGWYGFNLPADEVAGRAETLAGYCRAGAILRHLGLPADLIGTSEDWDASKPDAAFFEAVAAAAPCPAGQIAYVGDRLDNDLMPAKAAGMRTVFIRRGPGAYAWEDHPDLASGADWRVTSLAELPGLLAAVNQSSDRTARSTP